MPQFLFLIRDYEPSSKQYTPEELQQVIQRYSTGRAACVSRTS